MVASSSNELAVWDGDHGDDSGMYVKAFHPSRHPFVIGTYLFAGLGIGSSIVYYLSYF